MRIKNIGVAVLWLVLARCAEDKTRTPDGGERLQDGGLDGGIIDAGKCECDREPNFCDPGCECDIVCGSRQDEEPCRSSDDCAEALRCIKPDESFEIGFCIFTCNPLSPDNSQCPANKTCIMPEEGNTMFGICVEMCSLSDQEQCGEGRACYWLGEQPNTGICFLEGEKERWKECEHLFDCARGMICPPQEEEDESLSYCVEICTPSGEVQCREESYECVPFDEDGEEDVGMCMLQCTDFIENDCPEGFTCVPSENEGTQACIPAGSVPEGGMCEEMFGECEDGLICMHIDPNAPVGFCAKPCSVSDGRGCTQNQVCLGEEGGMGVCLTTCSDPFVNTCPEGLSCYWMIVGSLCLPPGSKAEGEECSVAFECEPGLSCSGVCSKLCNEPIGSHRCDEGKYCFAPGGRTGMCLEKCSDPVSGEGCSPSQGCYIFNGAENDGYCYWAGSAVENDLCNFSSDCEPGYFCKLENIPQHEGTCLKACTLEEPACDDNLTCISIEEGSSYGVCE